MFLLFVASVGIVDLYSLLATVTGGLGSAVVAFICERWPWFQRQGSQTKATIILVSTVALALGAQALTGVVNAETNSLAAPYVVILVTVITNWLAAQGTHAADKAFLDKDSILPKLRAPKE